MHIFASHLLLLVALAAVGACSSDDGPSGAGAGGSGGAAGSSTSSTAACSADPQPGESCTGSGMCGAGSNCYCLTGSISCADGPPPGGGSSGGGPGGGGPGDSTDGGNGDGADCGNNPEDGDNCDGFGLCAGDQDCFCFNDEVQCN